MRAGEPEPVPPGLVEQLIGSAKADGVMRFTHGLEEGETIRITLGSFCGVHGKAGAPRRFGESPRLARLIGRKGSGSAARRATSFPQTNWLELSPTCQAEAPQCAPLTLALIERRRVPNLPSSPFKSERRCVSLFENAVNCLKVDWTSQNSCAGRETPESSSA